LVLSIPIRFQAGAILGVVGFVLLGSALFSTFSLAVACVVKTRERFMGIDQVLTMPLFFAGNAIYPLAIMPAWLRALAGRPAKWCRGHLARCHLIPPAVPPKRRCDPPSPQHRVQGNGSSVDS
jgi:ABC-type multidrug transport system permease subunit